jgi:hypothetical protein
MLRAPVPKAPIDIDRYASWPKHHVNPVTRQQRKSCIHAESETTAMKLRPKAKLRSGIAPANPAHPCRNFRRGGYRRSLECHPPYI